MAIIGKPGFPRPVSKQRKRVETGLGYFGMDDAASGRNPWSGDAPAACFQTVETRWELQCCAV